MLEAAFILGFAGSFHCVAMCAPITLVLSAHSGANWRYYTGRFTYNLGRIATYTLLGAALGLVKEVFDSMLFNIHGVQEALSIGIGVSILAVLLVPNPKRAQILALPMLQRALGGLRGRIGAVMRESRFGGQFLLGLLNGLLPCGFVYMGLALAALSGSTTDAAWTMAAFGAGTLPAMFGVAVLARLAEGRFRLTSNVRRFAPFGAALVAVLFIMRGLALGIPYISPKLSAQPAGIEQGCHVPAAQVR
ncbi:MAG: sulfite exporter TauE/SafE family protein [Candidatus Kapabacteria bacterium]|jgi:hypothetical protein|nr:sulfite exporter TauE/SafE family protein [Candidatus Kapabacteria bacterium]